MGTIKKISIFVLGVVLTLIIGRKGYTFLFDSGVVLPDTLVGSSEAPLVGSHKGRYNYVRMLAIIDQCQKVQSAFHAQFSQHPEHVRIDAILAKELLADVYRERVRLLRYTQEMKVKYKGNVPEKKSRTLLYYQQIIDRHAKILEVIIRQL
jgi:hypothetical protein